MKNLLGLPWDLTKRLSTALGAKVTLAGDSWPNPAVHNLTTGYGVGSVWFGASELFLCTWASTSWATWVRLPLSVKKNVTIMLLDKDAAIAVADGLGNVEFPIPVELNGFQITDMVATISPSGTASSSGAITFQLARIRSGTPADVLDTALSIAESAKVSGTADIDTDTDDLATGDFLRIDCEGAGTGAKGPLWVNLVLDRPM
jgi:hypothetical protein